MKKKSAKKSNKKSKPVVKNTKRVPIVQEKDRSMERSWGKITDILNQVGKPTSFESPKDLAEKAVAYFKWVDEHPENRAELVKYEGSAEQVKVDLKRPYSMVDFCHFCNVSHGYFKTFTANIRAKGDAMLAQDRVYLSVIEAIKEKVESQQLSGSMTGHFNANIVSRLLGLVDKKDLTSGDAPIQAPSITVVASGPSLAGSEDKVAP